MTEEMRHHINTEIELALESGDNTRILRVVALSNKAMIECQEKTGKRVKDLLVWKEHIEAKAEGFKLAYAIYGVAGTGLGAGIMKLVEIFAR